MPSVAKNTIAVIDGGDGHVLEDHGQAPPFPPGGGGSLVVVIAMVTNMFLCSLLPVWINVKIFRSEQIRMD